MNKRISTVIKSFILVLVLSSVSFTVHARESLESLRNDLNSAINQINALQSQNAAQQIQIDELQVQVNVLKPVLYSIGDTGPAGGIVFHVTDVTGRHGLEAAPSDQGVAQWGCVGILIPGADAVEVGTGAQNTADILAGCNEAGIAAEFAHHFQLNGHSDWFLPSKNELLLMREQKEVLNANACNYWASSEYTSDEGWFLEFNRFSIPAPSCYHYDQYPIQYTKDAELMVRAIRAF